MQKIWGVWFFVLLRAIISNSNILCYRIQQHTEFFIISLDCFGMLFCENKRSRSKKNYFLCVFRWRSREIKIYTTFFPRLREARSRECTNCNHWWTRSQECWKLQNDREACRETWCSRFFSIIYLVFVYPWCLISQPL